MAENKRIRVSTDTTPLQELRQQGESVLQAFNQLEERFKSLATDSINLLRNQIDLLKERNDLLSGANLGINPTTEGIGQRRSEDAFKTPIGSLNGTDDILKKILERTVSIDQKMDRVEAQEGESGGKQEDDDLGGGNIVNSKLGRKIFSMASMAAIFGMVKRVAGVGRAFGEYEVGQATADNVYERRYAFLESKIMNTLTLGFSSLVAQEERKGLSRVEQNIETSRLYSQLYNLSYEQAISNQVRGYFNQETYADVVDEGRRRAIEDGGSPEGHGIKKFALNMAIANQTEVLNDQALGFFLADWIRGKKAGSTYSEKVEEVNNLRDEVKAQMLPDEMRSDILQTTGMSMTAYYKKIAELGRAGVRASNTKEEDLYQMLIGQTIRGYSDEMMRQVLAVTRFGATNSMSGSEVIRAIDKNLRGQGYDDQYIASTLDEYVGAFSRFAENILGKVGRIETDSMIMSMTSIQNATGTEGRQLERIQSALTGQSVSQDDVTQALLLRTARQMNPNLSMFDLEAMIENMPNDINLQRNFLKTLQDMAGGGDMMKYTLQAVFPNLSKNDILAIVEGRKDLTEIFDQGSVAAPEYNPEAAASKLTTKEVSEAGTENAQLLRGLADVFGKDGKKLDEIVDAIKEKRPVSLEDDSVRIIARGVSAGVGVSDFYLNTD